jgi:hypothetical protein
MLPLLLLAGVARCAVSSACPTDAELLTALRVQDMQDEALLSRRMTEQSGHYTHAILVKARAISAVACDAPSSEAPTIVSCNLLGDYNGNTQPRTVRLIKGDTGWAFARDR